MKLLADLHISPRTVEFLAGLGHDVLCVNTVLAASSPDETIVEFAVQEQRVILTQDLDFTALIALRGAKLPSLITLRLSSSRIENVNTVLEKIPPNLQQDVLARMIGTIEDDRIRRRSLPIS